VEIVHQVLSALVYHNRLTLRMGIIRSTKGFTRLRLGCIVAQTDSGCVERSGEAGGRKNMSADWRHRGMNRRSFLGTGTFAAASLLAGRHATSLFAQDTRGLGATGIVQTTSGKVRGVVQDRISVFYGIPYGASTTGPARFMPPTRPQPWTGVRDMLEYGPRSPQGPSGLIPEDAAEDRREPSGEDCLRLNIWTPATGSGRRPVMVWLHGGGFAQASGSFIIYDGANLARRRDVVVVTLNHRLNVFGFLYLAELGGEKYANSTNVGMQDVVLALEWVRDNITGFGGDPGNVTVFGQSGGGGKVSALMGMPSAKGLFHRAIAMSGSMVNGMPHTDATRNAETLLSRLNVKANQLDDLQKLSVEQILTAMQGAAGSPGGAGGRSGRGGAGGGLNFSPVIDGKTIPAGPFDPVASPLCSGVPLLIGSTETEVTFNRNSPLDDMDETVLRDRVKQAVRADDAAVDSLIATYRKGRPGITNIDLYLILASDQSFRDGVMTVAERKADQRQAAVYMYYFTWRSPVRDGKLKAFHTLDIPFVFENVDLATAMTGAHQSRYVLEDKMSAAWAAFARTGNPNHKGMPEWPAFDTTRRATMFLDNECRVVNDPNRDERLVLKQTASR
jgi:para-nitrobenzyl esterase